MSSAAEIRQQFLDFFKSKQHLIVPSAPIVVKNDPTLLFTNAGMNPFKDYFLGTSLAPSPRVADTQKCLRVSGKHNDLEEVGVDTYHHTMFEMLGNWSFGNPADPAAGYFKKEAIAWSWELLTEVYKIPKENLYVTIFEGDASEGLDKDEESYSEWKKYVDEAHILPGNKKDNFWEMGDTGPCGPCTEIHADCRTAEEKAAVSGDTLVNNDHPQVIEIWNNVFIQYNRKKDKSLEPLPARHVDTGMGYERLVRVLQGKTSNYDTDIFTPTIIEIEKICGLSYAADDSKESVAFRVLADHIRAICFTIADGQLPSNTGAGYVIRRILRRAVRYYYTYLNVTEPMLHRLVPPLAAQFGLVFPELQGQEAFVSKVIKEEEESFLRTLEKGLKKLDSVMAQAKENTVAGSDAFELLDTYGFPIDLTRLIASEKNLSVDEAGFEAEMKQQKNRSRAATTIDAGDWIIVNDGESLGYAGYESKEVQTKVLRYRKVKAKGLEMYQIILEQTPFYAESGGQVGDRGTLIIDDVQIAVTDTKKENGQIIHFAQALPPALSGTVTATVENVLRQKTTLHHSATHLMHAALRKVLGTHVVQKGSLVNADYLRFDFSHFSKMTAEEIQQVEGMVNEKIRENIAVVTKQMSKDEAIALGAMALFGEKYGEEVRVVIMDEAYSLELCGGTHVARTGDLGLFKITSEAAVAAGVRRIEAFSGAAAETYVQQQLDKLAEIKTAIKNTQDPVKAIEALQEENTKMSKHVAMLEARELVAVRNEILKTDEIINQVTFIGQVVQVPNAEGLKTICLDLKNQLHDYVVVLCANINGKAAVAIGISETVAKAKNLDAAKLIKTDVAPVIKGGGGGNAFLATAGGQDTGSFKVLIEKIRGEIMEG